MTTIRIKHSDVPGVAPKTLKHGEIALNTADGLLFFGNNKAESVKFSHGGSADQRKFAYDDAIDSGEFKGTELEWLKSLQAIKADVPVDKKSYVRTGGTWKDIDLVVPKSAFQKKKEEGYTDTEEKWIVSIVPINIDAPDDGYAYARKAKQWVRAAGGADRKTAYEEAVEGGYKGTELEWLHEKIAPVGDDAPADKKVYGRKDHKWVEVTGGGTGRKTDFEKAVEAGYKDTETAWIKSLSPAGQDAPSDGKFYARKDGKWVEIVMPTPPVPSDKLIKTPVNKHPHDGEIINVNQIDIMASDFSSTFDTPHADSNFQVSLTEGFDGFNLLADTVNIGPVTCYTFKAKPEFYNQPLYWRVCYIDETGEESAYSAPTTFTINVDTPVDIS